LRQVSWADEETSESSCKSKFTTAPVQKEMEMRRQEITEIMMPNVMGKKYPYTKAGKAAAKKAATKVAKKTKSKTKKGYA